MATICNEDLKKNSVWGPAQHECKAHGQQLDAHFCVFSLHVWSIEILLSHVKAVHFRARQSPDRFHAHRRTPSLHFLRQKFENAGVCFLACAVGQLILNVFQSFIPNRTNVPFNLGIRRISSLS